MHKCRNVSVASQSRKPMAGCGYQSPVPGCHHQACCTRCVMTAPDTASQGCAGVVHVGARTCLPVQDAVRQEPCLLRLYNAGTSRLKTLSLTTETGQQHPDFFLPSAASGLSTTMMSLPGPSCMVYREEHRTQVSDTVGVVGSWVGRHSC